MTVSTREKVFRFVSERIVGGVPPTVREVQERFGFQSVGTAREHLDRLIAEGRLMKMGGVSRGFRLPGARQEGRPFIVVPILGRVQAGTPTLAVEDIEGTVSVEHSAEEDLFALKVKGDSMRDAGILEGDIVVVRRQANADDSDIVVVLLEDEATVKRLRRRRGYVELHPANPAYEPIRLKADLSACTAQAGKAQLLGKVIEVRRYL